MKIIAPYPNMNLSPNKKHGRHYAVAHDSKVKQRDAGFYLAKEALGKQRLVKKDYYALKLLFVRKDRNIPDLDNTLSAAKSLLDGIAMGLGVNDKQFKPVTIDWLVGKTAQTEIEIDLNEVTEV